jgi:hypothetical protein
MRVRARALALSAIPAKIEPYTRQIFTTVDKEYDVHAVAVFDGIPFLQFVDELGYPAWSPSLLFEVTDTTLPTDWICNAIPTDDGGSLFLLGPDFVARDEASYSEMVELDADQVDRFWKRVKSMEEREA